MEELISKQQRDLIVTALKNCSTHSEVDNIIRDNPVEFEFDKDLNNIDYNVRYEIERKRIENIKTTKQ
jgi:hypothetical protein